MLTARFMPLMRHLPIDIKIVMPQLKAARAIKQKLELNNNAGPTDIMLIKTKLLFADSHRFAAFREHS